MKEIGVYIHIPFCKHKCSYCDFVSFEGKDDLIQQYIKCLKDEIRIKKNNDYLVKTIYIGGGTPSYISAKSIKDILNVIREKFKVDENAEITIEINPGTIDKEKMQTYIESGINRISVGLQSSNDSLLKEIDRIHNFEQFLETIKIAKSVGFSNINADVMIGLPNQTIYDVEDTINLLLKENLQHISVYSLIVEDGTKIKKQIENKKLSLPDEEIERYMYWFTKRKLEKNGFIHYEISNFAKPGYASKHNMDCWNQKEYIGFGLNASSYEDDVRYKNTSDLKIYIKNLEKGEQLKNIQIEEKQDKKAKMDEFFLLGLRKINGVNLNEFEHKFNENPIFIYKDTFEKLLDEDLIVFDINYVKLSKKGLDLANQVWEEFV